MSSGNPLGGWCFARCVSGYPPARPRARCPFERVVYAMNELEKLTRDVRGFATEVRTLGYSSVAGGHENQFLELSERMIRHADQVDRRSH
jgi:hypothetical protein